MKTTKAELDRFMAEFFPQNTTCIEDVGDMSAVVRHCVTEKDLRPGGTVSGPVMFAIADVALYVAILGEIGIVPLAVTTNLTLNFLRKPAADRDLIAKCKMIKIGRTQAVGEVCVFSEGSEEPVAHAVGTYAIPRHD
jgi:uncharacterized protein (TIGR00369 family)